MKILHLFVGLLICTSHLFAQTNAVIGTWWSPKGFAGVSYTFDSSGTVKFHSFTCMSAFNRTGQYKVVNTTILIVYDSLTAQEKAIYGIKIDMPFADTLVIVNRHKIKVNEQLFIYDKILDDTYTLTDSVFKAGLYHRTHQILFDFNTFVLQPTSYPFLDSLVGFLTTHKSLSLEIAQHGETNPKFSTQLSVRQAEAIRAYLLSKGIHENRLAAVGYGDTKPIWSSYEIKKAKSKEHKEKLRQQNRRTEFIILRTDFTE